MALSWQELTLHAETHLRKHPDGLRYRDLMEHLASVDPESCHSRLFSVVKTLTRCPNVIRPTRGHYVYVEVPEETHPTEGEAAFYTGFAKLIAEVEGCKPCLSLGGNRLGMGTPDIVGRVPGNSGAIVPYPDQIVAGEVKCEMGLLLHAFGQAIAYTRYAHKSYLAIPESTRPELRQILDELCSATGVGLVMFNSLDPGAPDFRLVRRAVPGQPDMSLLNRKFALLRNALFPV